MSDPARPLYLVLCPTCEGRPVEVGACVACDGTGIIDNEGRAFSPPPPFDTWVPANVVALDKASRDRDGEARERQPLTTKEGWRLTRDPAGQPVAAPERPRRLTMSQIVELLLTRQTTEHSTVKLTRNAKGETQIEVSVRTGEVGIETPEQAQTKAQQVYDHLTGLYPMARADA